MQKFFHVLITLFVLCAPALASVQEHTPSFGEKVFMFILGGALIVVLILLVFGSFGTKGRYYSDKH